MVMSYQQARDFEQRLQDEFGEDVVRAEVTGGLPEHPEDEEAQEDVNPVGDPWIRVEADQLPGVVEYLKNEPDLAFDSLHCLGGDHLADTAEMVTIYHLYSMSERHWIILKVFTPDDEPVVPSITDLYRAADWHEREAYDMLGIRFDGHPDLRRLLLPEDWVGYPLRKDYEFPQFYRGLPVDWDEAREARMSRDDFYSEADELEEMTDIDEELRFPGKDTGG